MLSSCCWQDTPYPWHLFHGCRFFLARLPPSNLPSSASSIIFFSAPASMFACLWMVHTLKRSNPTWMTPARWINDDIMWGWGRNDPPPTVSLHQKPRGHKSWSTTPLFHWLWTLLLLGGWRGLQELNLRGIFGPKNNRTRRDPVANSGEVKKLAVKKRCLARLGPDGPEGCRVKNKKAAQAKLGQRLGKAEIANKPKKGQSTTKWCVSALAPSCRRHLSFSSCADQDANVLCMCYPSCPYPLKKVNLSMPYSKSS